MSDMSPREAAQLSGGDLASWIIDRIEGPTSSRIRAGLHDDIEAAIGYRDAARPEPEHAALADGTVLRDRTAAELGITNHGDEARWTPPPDPDDLLARLDCGCDPDQGHHTCQKGGH